MRLTGNLQLKFRSLRDQPNRLFLQHKHIVTSYELCLRALNVVQFSIDDDDPKPNSVNLLKEINLALKCAMFPCIKIGDSPLIRIYGEGITTPIMDSELKDMEEYEKVDEKNLEPWHSLGSVPVKLVPPFEKKSVKEPLLSYIAPWEGVLDIFVKLLPQVTSRQAKMLETSGFPTIRKLLNHFPRTYADLQNPQEDTIVDGHYYRFAGEVISSKGRLSCASPDLGILEVVVGCELQNFESKYNGVFASKSILSLETVHKSR